MIPSIADVRGIYYVFYAYSELRYIAGAEESNQLVIVMLNIYVIGQMLGEIILTTLYAKHKIVLKFQLYSAYLVYKQHRGHMRERI